MQSHCLLFCVFCSCCQQNSFHCSKNQCFNHKVWMPVKNWQQARVVSRPNGIAWECFKKKAPFILSTGYWQLFLSYFRHPLLFLLYTLSFSHLYLRSEFCNPLQTGWEGDLISMLWKGAVENDAHCGLWAIIESNFTSSVWVMFAEITWDRGP